MLAPTDWRASPGPCGPTLTNVMQATDISVLPDSLANLQAAWRKRHEGVRAVARKNVAPVRYMPCKYGICCCQPGFVRKVAVELSAVLRRRNIDGAVTGGEIVLMWIIERYEHPDPEVANAVRLGNRASKEVALALGCEASTVRKFTQVATCNLRPFRPILVAVHTTSDAPPPAPDTALEVRQTRSNSGEPKLYTVPEWCQSELNPNDTISVSCLPMSQRHTAIAGFHGQAYLLMSAIDEPHLIWSPGQDDKPKRIRRTRTSRKGPDLAEDDRPLTDDVDMFGPAASKDSSANEDGLLPQDWEFLNVQARDEDEAIHSSDGFEDLIDAVLKRNQTRPLLERAAQRSGQPETGAHSDRPRSSSSSSSSSDSSSTSRPREPLIGGLKRTRADGSYRWGAFTLTWRKFKIGSKPAWQATCPYHGDYDSRGSLRTACTRSRQVNQTNDDYTTEASQKVLEDLKKWLVVALQFDNKAAHQRCKLQQEVEEPSGSVSMADSDAMPPPPASAARRRRASASQSSQSASVKRQKQ